MRRGLAVALVTVTSVFGAGTAASAQEPHDEWTTAVCTSLTTWAETLAELAADLPSGSGQPLPRAKARLVGFMEDALGITETLVDDIRDAGYPDVENGQAIGRVFRTGVVEARRVFAKAVRDTQRLPTSNRARFRAAGRRIERALDRGGSEIEETFDKARDRYPTPTLDAAFRDDPACEGIAGS